MTDPATVTAGGQASVDLMQNALEFQLQRGTTLIRTVGDIWVRPGDASAETEGVFGIHLIEPDAENASAIPDPLSDTGAGWLHWERFLVGSQATGELATGAYVKFHLDIKAKRTFRMESMSVDFIIENDDGMQTFTFALGLRMLLMGR